MQNTIRVPLARLLAVVGLAISMALIGCAQPQEEQSSSEAAHSSSLVLDVSRAGQNAVAIDDVGKKTAMIEDGRLDLLVLVNKRHKIPEGWEARLDLVKVGNSRGETVELDAVAAQAFKELQQDLQSSEGIDIEIGSGYRSVSDQKRVWDEYLVDYGEDYVYEYVAEPGYSEHQTGLALDADLIENGVPVHGIDEAFERQGTWGVIHSYLAKHGFILRYPYGAEDVTGFAYEPWHFRYVGKADAKAIMSQDITLEDYLGNYGNE
jgi:LAS superfamily LD-carboxypeptidase LdcB